MGTWKKHLTCSAEICQHPPAEFLSALLWAWSGAEQSRGCTDAPLDNKQGGTLAREAELVVWLMQEAWRGRVEERRATLFNPQATIQTGQAWFGDFPVSHILTRRKMLSPAPQVLLPPGGRRISYKGNSGVWGNRVQAHLYLHGSRTSCSRGAKSCTRESLIA